jgi:transcription elongation factor Elf1
MQSAQYFHARQACYTCLNPNDVVDTGVQIEGEGELAICRSCIADLARTAGFDLDDRSKDIKKLEMQVTRLQADVKHYKAFRDQVLAGVAEKV